MIPVVFATDHNFIMPTGVAIKSLVDAATTSNYDIFIFQSENVTDQDRAQLSSIVKEPHRISYITTGEEVKNAFEIREISYATYFRFFIPSLIPQYDKVLYLDGDIIVCKDLGELYKTDLSDNLMAGVRTYGLSTVKKYRRYFKKIGAEPGGYINAGILLINSKQWRDEDLVKKFLKETRNKYLFQDQDILNKVCRGQIKFIPLKYNFNTIGSESNFLRSGCTTETEIKEAINSPVIIHFSGEKPWKSFTMHWRRWWKVYENSPFYDEDFENNVSHNYLSRSLKWKEIIKISLRKIVYQNRKY